MKKIILALPVLMLLAFSFHNAYACSCSLPTQKEEFNDSEIVIIGKFIRQTDDGVELKVTKSWKGAKKGKIIKLFYIDMIGCGWDMDFVSGNEYLIYAYKPVGNGEWIKYPIISVDCGRSRAVEDAKEDIKNMEEIAKQK